MRITLLLFKRKYYLILLILVFSNNSFACDACSFLEYGNLQNQSYASLSYRHRALNGYKSENHTNNFSLNGAGNFRTLHQVTNGDTIYDSQKDQEAFRSIELKANINLKNNWNIIGVIPYNIHKVYFESTQVLDFSTPIKDSTNTIKGFGDVRLYLEKYWVIGENKWKAYLRISPGVQLPTGEIGKSNNGVVFDPVIQPGMGVWAFMLRTNNTLIYQSRLGTSLGANYLKARKKDLSNQSVLSTINTSTANTSYEFGGRFNLQWNIFYIINYYNDFQLIPSLGLYYESIQEDKLDGKTISDLGGQTLFAQLGMELMLKKYSLQLNYSPVINNQLNGQQIENAGMFSTSLIYRFGKKSKQTPSEKLDK